ncbi:MAG TPA: carbohydrate porin [Planctomycetota bacterium]
MLAILLVLQNGAFGVPDALRERGVGWTIVATGEVLSNVDGGLDEGTEAQALLDAVLDADLEKLAGWTGATARANPMWIEGHGLTRDHVGDLTKISNIDASDGLRLFELWLQQAVGCASVRAGLLSTDQEFALSESSALFVNATFGLPILFSMNAPFSAYPLGALGVRLRAEPVPGFSAMAAVYEGSPDAESRNRSGTEVRLHDDEGLLWIGEAGWKHASGTIKAGGFAHSGDFLDHSSGDVRSGLHGVYAVVDQTLAAGLAVFVRGGAAPERAALISRYVEAGAVWTGPIPGRPSDQLGLAWMRAELSDEIPGARYETVVEATVKIVVLSWLIVQPDVQYVRHPGGFGTIEDATVVGLRVDVTF